MNRTDPLFKLRLPDFLREKLEKEAANNRRSLTAEILGRLEMSFSDTAERLDRLESEVFHGERGNEDLAGRVRELEREVETLSRSRR
ncbi:Arc family DNA-binding protein [Humitalea sp. 24SJ18S-53]|uniref:Arc family DNA-binding protein n=1 Tax=Humitalea sp. 24SJ18S-53 TaxID=3422307 RepID=UPI003D6744AE